MQPGSLIPAFIQGWLIAVLGGYLAIVGLGNLRRHYAASQPAIARRGHFFLRRQLFLMRDIFLLLLGVLLMPAGMVVFYTLVYG